MGEKEEGRKREERGQRRENYKSRGVSRRARLSERMNVLSVPTAWLLP